MNRDPIRGILMALEGIAVEALVVASVLAFGLVVAAIAIALT
jgi:hypothetical protein